MPRSVWFATAVAIMVLGHSRAAGEGDGWIGRRVFTRYGATLKIGSRVVDDEGRVRSHAASGKDRRTFRVYRVEQIQGPWLWLVSETQGVSGWVKAVDAIPCDQAIAYATAVLYSNPTSAAYVARGIAWHDARQYDRAIVDYNEAIRLNPWNEVAYQNRANALEVQGRFAEALADYDMATRLDPGFDFPYNSRAWMRATCPDPRYRDGRQAVADAMRACQLSDWKEVDYLGTLAAACAEVSDFAAAVRWQAEALRLHRGAEEDRRGFAARLELYQARKPYRSQKKGHQ
jgi:hypothetical protein